MYPLHCVGNRGLSQAHSCVLENSDEDSKLYAGVSECGELIGGDTALALSDIQRKRSRPMFQVQAVTHVPGRYRMPAPPTGARRSPASVHPRSASAVRKNL